MVIRIDLGRRINEVIRTWGGGFEGNKDGPWEEGNIGSGKGGGLETPPQTLALSFVTGIRGKGWG